MQTFVRMSKLSDIVGRSDYISNPERQEDIVATRNYADWKEYQAYERKHQRSNTPNNEGRELIIALPNEWQKFDELDMTSHMNDLAQRLLPGKYKYQWAVHWNKARTNLHVHLIFSERDPAYKNTGVWDRDIYLTQDGKIARKKADRAVDKNGNIKPPIHRKGDPKSDGKCEFTAKDPKFKTKRWLEQAKQTVTEYFKYYRVELEEKKLLHQYHEGKGKEAETIHAKNEHIKQINKAVDIAKYLGFTFPKPSSAEHMELCKKLLAPNYYPLKAFDLAETKPILSVCKIASKERYDTMRSFIKQENIHCIFTEKDLTISVRKSDVPKMKEIAQKVTELFNKKVAQEKKSPIAAATASEPKKLSPPPSEPKPTLNVDRLIALYADCIKKASIANYLVITHEDTTAQEAYTNGQQAVNSYQTALQSYEDINAKIKGTHNPFKKITLKSERDEAEKKLKFALEWMRRALQRRFDIQAGQYGSIINDTQESLNQLKHAAAEEIRGNSIIKKLRTENINEDSARIAFKALVNECKGLSIGEGKKALRALQSAQIPLLIFETAEYRAMVIAEIDKSIKPILESKIQKTEKLQENPEKKVETIEKEPPQITYGGRSR